MEKETCEEMTWKVRKTGSYRVRAEKRKREGEELNKLCNII